MRRLAAVISILLAAAAAATPAAAAEPRASLTDIEDEVMCPICGTPLNLAAAPQAERQRAYIRRLIARGETKDEIKDALVREYGPEVLATPDSEGIDLAAWIVPIGGVLVAAVAVFIGLRRWRRRPDENDERGDGQEPDPSDSERLRSDLARYDL
ncbi:MAG: cytochrome c-type biogenesis protein [Solirubrobacterales bacterium]